MINMGYAKLEAAGGGGGGGGRRRGIKGGGRVTKTLTFVTRLTTEPFL